MKRLVAFVALGSDLFLLGQAEGLTPGFWSLWSLVGSGLSFVSFVGQAEGLTPSTASTASTASTDGVAIPGPTVCRRNGAVK